MLSQKVPVATASMTALLLAASHRGFSAEILGGTGNSPGHGSFRIQLHVTPRREGARLGPGVLPCGPCPRRLQWPLLLSGAGSAGGGCRRQRAAQRNRSADHKLSAVFGRARRLHAVALRHERNGQDRRGGGEDP